jgi:hypothetical protein
MVDELKLFTEQLRRKIFAALVELEEHEKSVTEARRVIAERFGITPDQVTRIEGEGINDGWTLL